MLNVALITHAYAESDTPAGLYTAALAHAFTARGHRVHVIAARNTVPRPRHESTGTLTIHRLGQRRGSPTEAFALNATRRLFELGITEEFDVVECIDAPSCITAIAALRACLTARFGLVSVRTDPAAQLDPHNAAADGLADAVIRGHETREFSTSTLTQEPNQLPNLAQEELVTVATAHEDLWDGLRPGQQSTQAAGAWRSLEQSLSRRPIGA